MRLVYTLIWIIALPLVLARLMIRGRKEPGYRRHIAERFGWYPGAKPHQPVLWVHAVSVGETRAAEPLVRKLRQEWPDHLILLSHMTPTGRATGADLFKNEISAGTLVQCYLPYDLVWLVNGLLAHFRPELCVLMETEVWPNLIHACQRAQIPVALVNARLSPKSLAKAQRLAALIQPASSAISQVAAQTAADAQRIAQLGVAHITVTGNSKFDVSIPDQKLEAGQHLRKQLCPVESTRSVLVCASTREGEEELILDAYCKAAAASILLVIVPRHPQRFDQVEQLIRQRGLSLLRRSEMGELTIPDTVQIILGDTMGEMIAYFVSGDLAFIGGSLLPLGGQNLIEACAVGKPVLLGPHTFNFDAVSRDALEAGAGLRVADAQELFNAAQTLFNDPERLGQMGEHARKFAAQHRGATERTVQLLKDLCNP